MYSKNDLLRVLKRNLDSEMDIVKFYIKNIMKFNYVGNRAKIDKLVLESLTHATAITKEILNISSTDKGNLNKKAQEKALKEEAGLKEIYKYELSRSKNPDSKKLLRWLIKEEAGHERVVRSLK